MPAHDQNEAVPVQSSDDIAVTVAEREQHQRYEEVVEKNVLQLYGLVQANERGTVFGKNVQFHFGKEADGVTVWGADVEGSSWGMLKARTILEGDAPKVVEAVTELLYAGERNSDYDDMADQARTVERLWDGKDKFTRKELRYVTYKAVWPTTARDFFILLSQRRLDDQTVVICSFSVEHPQYPPFAHYVRGQLLLSGYVIKQLSDTQVELTLCSWIDLSGYIPGRLMKSLSISAPLHMLRTIKSLVAKDVAAQQTATGSIAAESAGETERHHHGKGDSSIFARARGTLTRPFTKGATAESHPSEPDTRAAVTTSS